MDVQLELVNNNYNNFKSLFNLADNSNVEIIKRRFKFSLRRMDYIQSFATLIKLLEKSGELDAFNIEPLEVIAQHLQEPMRSELVNLIQLHWTLVSKCGNLEFPICNQYAKELSNVNTECCSKIDNITISKNTRKKGIHNKKSGKQSSNTSTKTSNDESFGAQNDKIIDPYAHFNEAIDCISQEIGIKWKDMARYLRLKEEDIEEIDHSEKLLKEKARRSLRLFLAEEPANLKDNMIQALKKSRRNDIVKKIIILC